MARQKEFRPLFGSEGFVEITETITLGTAMQTLSNRGVSFVVYDTSAQPNDAVIPDPDFIGQTKYVLLDNQTTSLEANFNLGSTARVLWGTTFNTLTVNSTANDAPAFQLIAVSTSQWALLNRTANLSTAALSVDWALSATTGSTGQA